MSLRRYRGTLAPAPRNIRADRGFVASREVFRKKDVRRSFYQLEGSSLCWMQVLYISHGDITNFCSFPQANLSSQTPAKAGRIVECSPVILLSLPLFPAPLLWLGLCLVPCAATGAMLAEPQESSRRGEAAVPHRAPSCKQEWSLGLPGCKLQPRLAEERQAPFLRASPVLCASPCWGNKPNTASCSRAAGDAQQP